MIFLYCAQVVEEPYTMREARIHLRHVRDLLKSLDPSDAYNGLECSSLSFLNVITQGDILGTDFCIILLCNNIRSIAINQFNASIPCFSCFILKFDCKVLL